MVMHIRHFYIEFEIDFFSKEREREEKSCAPESVNCVRVNAKDETQYKLPIFELIIIKCKWGTTNSGGLAALKTRVID